MRNFFHPFIITKEKLIGEFFEGGCNMMLKNQMMYGKIIVDGPNGKEIQVGNIVNFKLTNQVVIRVFINSFQGNIFEGLVVDSYYPSGVNTLVEHGKRVSGRYYTDTRSGRVYSPK